MVTAPLSESISLGSPTPNDSRGTPDRSAKKRTLKPTMKEITVAFMRRTKVHGMKFVFSPDKTKPQRVLWLLAFFVCVSLLATWSTNRIAYLMSYPVVTKIHMVWAHKMAFPAITFCNHNIFRVSSMTQADLYHSGYWMDLMFPNHTVMDRSLSILRESHKPGLLGLLDFSQYTPPQGHHADTTEMMDRLGHQLEDMLLECKFRGENCTHKNFSTVCTDVQECR
ncbi:acid-sensing ion channel 2-like [Aplochiton taeniatus]